MSFLLLCIYLINFFIRPQDWIPFFWGWPVDYIIIIPALILGLMGKIGKNTNSKDAFVFLPIHYFVLAYLLIIPFSNIVHGNISMAIEQFVLFFKKICVFAMFVLIIDTPQKLKKIAKFVLILSVFLAIQGFFQSITKIGWADQTLYQQGRYGMRVQWVGYWDGANTLALGLAVAIPLAMGFFSISKSILSRIIYSLFGIILVYGIYLTNSRGGFLALASILPLFIWTKIRGKKKYVYLVIVLMLLPSTIKFGPSRVRTFDTKQDSAHERTWLWESGLNSLRENPLFGIGKGQYSVGVHTRAHSNFIQNFSEVGLIGSFLWFGMIYLAFKGIYIVKKSLNYNSMLKYKYKKEDVGLSFIRFSEALFICFGVFNVGTLFITVEIEPLYYFLALLTCTAMIAKNYNKKINTKFSFIDIGNIGVAMVAVLFFYYLAAMKEVF